MAQVFPTPPLARPGGKGKAGELQSSIAPLPENVTMLPNPATFTLGEVGVGIVPAAALNTQCSLQWRRT